MSTYLNKAHAEKVLEILHRNGLGCHPCTFTRDAMDAAAAVLRKEVRASKKLETLERELAEAKAELVRKDEALAEIASELTPPASMVEFRLVNIAAAALAQGGKGNT